MINPDTIQTSGTRIFSICLATIFLLGCNLKKTENKVLVDTSEFQDAPPINEVSAGGIDISKYQGNLVDEIRSSDSLFFIICRATEGTNFRDPDFIYNWQDIQNKGLIRGAYHVYRCNEDELKQSENILRTVGKLALADLPLIIEIQGAGIPENVDKDSLISEVLNFLELIREGSEKTPIVCTNSVFANEYLIDSRFGAYPLWFVETEILNLPNLPSAWKKVGWTFRRQTASYLDAGQTADFDIFNGTLIELMEFIQKSQVN